MRAILGSLILSGILTTLLIPADAAGQRVERRYGTVTVLGEATADAVPDQATIRFGIVTRAEDPEEARRLNAEAARRAMNEVRALVPDERKIRLESLRLQPAREYDPDTRRYIDLGFEAIRDVVVEVEDLDELPTIVARIVQQGANRLHSVTYELENQDMVLNLALERALLNAREKASLMANTLGAGLGRVLQIEEQPGSTPGPVVRQAMMETMAASKVADPEPEAYAAGELEVRAVVEVVFALRNDPSE